MFRRRAQYRTRCAMCGWRSKKYRDQDRADLAGRIHLYREHRWGHRPVRRLNK